MAASTTDVDADMLVALSEAFNRDGIDAVMSFMAEDCVFEGAAGNEACGVRYQGKKAVCDAFVEVWTRLPDVQWQHVQHFVADNQGVSEWTFTATRADGKRIEVGGCDPFTFGEGQIARKQAFRKERSPIE